MNNRIDLVGSRQGLTIHNCLEKLLEFCAFDAYQGYDMVGYSQISQPHVIQTKVLAATNSAMRARSKVAAWTPFLDKTFEPLINIPVDFDVVFASAGKFEGILPAIRACFCALTCTPWITDMAASKVLHLKRPGVFAISDSYVREALAIPAPNRKVYPRREQYCTAQGVSVIQAVREIGQANLVELEELQAKLHISVPSVQLSTLRIIDILVWVDMAIGRHQRWTQVAADRDWRTIAEEIAA